MSTGNTLQKKSLSRANKKEGEELQLYFHFKKRHGVSKTKKGKGSYNRKKLKKIIDF
jgi:hypothetical protein